MKIGQYTVTIFKIRNRKGFAAICNNNLTEGKTEQEAFSRMEKAVRRTEKGRKG